MSNTPTPDQMRACAELANEMDCAAEPMYNAIIAIIDNQPNGAIILALAQALATHLVSACDDESIPKYMRLFKDVVAAVIVRHTAVGAATDINNSALN